MKNRSVLQVLGLCAALLLAACQQQPMVPMKAVAVPAGLSDKQVAHAVRLALADRGWVAGADKPGDIHAVLTRGDEFVCKIDVTYDQRVVNVAYLDSTGLKYDNQDGRQYIHYRYNDWMNFLQTSLQTRLALTAEGEK